MRRIAPLLIIACSGTPEAPQATSPSATPPTVVVAAPDAGSPSVTTPSANEWAPPQPIDHLAKLPKVDFVPAYAKSTDEVKLKQAEAPFLEARALHAKQDWAGAEAKYVAALGIDAGHLLARYYLAGVYNRTNRGERALALLVELTRTDCACLATVSWDDDWATQFGEEPFWQALAIEHRGTGGVDWVLDVDEAPAFTCPPGTKKVGTWTHARRELYCAKGTVKHGPYAFVTKGWHAAEIDTSETGVYRNGKQHGPWSARTGMYSGWSGAFVDGERHGVWVEYEKESTKRLAYDRGVQVGLEQTTDESGVIIAERRDGIHRTWKQADDGKTYFLTDVTQFKDGKIVHSISYDGPGRISAQGPYLDGNKTGVWKFYAEAKLVQEVTYAADKKHGKEVFYGDDGKPTSIAHWDHGKRHGVFEYWHAGKLLAKTTMEQDTGDWIEYRDDRLMQKGRLVNGVRTGPWELDQNGQFDVGPFVAGKRNGAWTIYADDRKTKQAEGTFKNDKKHGAWTVWRTTDDGTKIEGKGGYADDKLDGTWKIIVDSELAQTLGFRKGALVTVDGRRATKQWQNGYARSHQFPEVIEESDSEPPM